MPRISEGYTNLADNWGRTKVVKSVVGDGLFVKFFLLGGEGAFLASPFPWLLTLVLTSRNELKWISYDT